MAVQTGSGGIPVEFRPMSPEEIERTMQFLLHQQAQFAADFAKSSERMARIDETIERQTRRGEQTQALLEQMGVRLEQLDVRLDRVAEHLERLTDHVSGLTDHVDGLNGLMKDLMSLFDRHLRDDHGRRPS